MSRFVSRAALWAGIVACAASGVANAQQAGLKVGSKAPDYTFNGEMLNGDGRTDLKEFRGNVVLLDFWGNH